MGLQRRPNHRKAQITKIATACLGALFVVLLVKTLAGNGKKARPTNRASAAPRVTEEIAASTVPAARAAEPSTRGAESEPRFIPSLPDSVGPVPPPDPFRMTPKLQEELTGVRQSRKAPAAPARPARIQFKLQGIVADLKKGEHVALIDDELLRVGDSHRGYTVLEITPVQVILDDGEDRRALQLEEK